MSSCRPVTCFEDLDATELVFDFAIQAAPEWSKNDTGAQLSLALIRAVPAECMNALIAGFQDTDLQRLIRNADWSADQIFFSRLAANVDDPHQQLRVANACVNASSRRALYAAVRAQYQLSPARMH